MRTSYMAIKKIFLLWIFCFVFQYRYLYIKMHLFKKLKVFEIK